MGETILVVEDDETSLMIMTTILENESYNVVGVPNAEEALEKLAAHPETKVILLDWVLPGMDGMEYLKQVRAKEEYNHIPVIMQTGNHTAGDVKKAIDTGADDYLIKPVNQEKAIQKVAHWLETGRKK
ncbi:MAG: response regulator [Rickettsiales bacterium]|nr:response regulator [Rickettsiales bacterium]